MTDDSAFKKRVRARMAETGEKYTEARRAVIAEQEPGREPVVLRVYLSPHMDLALTPEAGRAYAAADEEGRREMAARLLRDELGAAGAASAILTEHQAREAAVRAAVLGSLERAVGVSAVEVDTTGDRLHVTVRAARPDVAWGFVQGAESEGAWRETGAERLRGELEELTGGRVRLDIVQAR